MAHTESSAAAGLHVGLMSGTSVDAIDSGPGNTLLDLWRRRHQGAAYDRDGQWSSTGEALS